MNIDIESAIQRCREIVNDDSDIIIDALMQVTFNNAILIIVK